MGRPVQQSVQKRDLYDAMLKEIRDYRGEHGGKIGQKLCQRLYHLVYQATFNELLATGRAQFPGGLGRLIVRRMQPTRRRHPKTGEMLTVDRERLQIKYVMGVQLQRIMGYGTYYKYRPAKESPIVLDPPKPMVPGV